MSRITLEIDEPRDVQLDEVVERIAEEIATGDEEGRVRIGDESLAWEIIRSGAGIDVDRRQRVAAAALMMGFDLPQEATAAFRSMMTAARLCPGMTTGDLPSRQGRREMLEFARDRIDEMLKEMAA